LQIVCGPPGAGKSTYVRDCAAQGERIICFDTIAEKIMGKPRPKLTPQQIGLVLRERNDQLGDLMRSSALKRWHGAWLIISAPERERRQGLFDKLCPRTIIVLTTPATECKRRVRLDKARTDVSETDAVIDRWWGAYSPRTGDCVVENYQTWAKAI